MQIDDDEVPLGVVDDEEDTEDELAEVRDEETPRANVAAAAEGVWWSWIPVVGAVASAVEGYRRNRKHKDDADGSKNE